MGQAVRGSASFGIWHLVLGINSRCAPLFVIATGKLRRLVRLLALVETD